MRLWPALLVLAMSCSRSGTETGAASSEPGGTAEAPGAGGQGPASGAAEAPGAGGQGPASSAAEASATGSATGGDPAARPGAAAGPAPADPAPATSGATCQKAPFAAELALPEASGSVWVEPSFGLPAHLVVVSDSGNRGAFAVVDAASGAALGSGRLPLDAAVSDDIEGLARAGGIYYALTSGGYVRHFRRTGATRFQNAVAPYPLAGASCDSPRRTNCGRDFEGLCLIDPLPPSGCAGFAASRRQGQLICIEVDGAGRLRPDLGRVIPVSLPMALSDCNIAPAEGGRALYAVTNALGGNGLLRVDSWRDPAGARVVPLLGHATGFVEAVAAGPGGAIYRFSDSGGPVSAMFLNSCPAPGPE